MCDISRLNFREEYQPSSCGSGADDTGAVFAVNRADAQPIVAEEEKTAPEKWWKERGGCCILVLSGRDETRVRKERQQ